ncbi:MAG: sigma-70 family RNA polymerase sigma factor [Planctomycetes bacterium]|nr:sigma-70 family RNA polymerase sigma factor [Planctomycetota bacterium]
MSTDDSQETLLAKAISGHHDAIREILWLHYDRLLARVAPQIPDSLHRSIDPEDVLQDTFVYVWQHIREFNPQGPESFYAWLETTARRKLLDRIRSHRRAKRGGGQNHVETHPHDGSSLASLLDLVAVDPSTPSGSAARHEAERALRMALAALPPHYQEVIDLRYLQQRPVAEVAARMGRSKGSVLMLCRRALEKLRRAMGSGSDFFSS